MAEYICPICNKRFTDLKTYAAHIQEEDKAADTKRDTVLAEKTLVEINKTLKQLEELVAKYNSLSIDSKAFVDFSIKETGKSNKNTSTTFSDWLKANSKKESNLTNENLDSLEAFLEAVLFGK